MQQTERKSVWEQSIKCDSCVHLQKPYPAVIYNQADI